MQFGSSGRLMSPFDHLLTGACETPDHIWASGKVAQAPDQSRRHHMPWETATSVSAFVSIERPHTGIAFDK
jgi:hypothetical protein